MLAGPRAFDSSLEERWRDHTVGEMLTDIRSKVPLRDPAASLSVQTYADMISYSLSKNAVPKDSEELPADLDKHHEIRITPEPADSRQP